MHEVARNLAAFHKISQEAWCRRFASLCIPMSMAMALSRDTVRNASTITKALKGNDLNSTLLQSCKSAEYLNECTFTSFC